MRGMEPRILVGTEGGLRSFGSVEVPADALAGHTVTALAHDGSRTWAIVDGRTLYASENRREWTAGAAVEGEHEATCLAPTSRGLFVGTEGAHLHRLQAGRLSPLDSFETVEGRQTWYTPWGDPADVRSITAERGAAVAIYANVHVGGVVRSHGREEHHRNAEVDQRQSRQRARNPQADGCRHRRNEQDPLHNGRNE